MGEAQTLGVKVQSSQALRQTPSLNYRIQQIPEHVNVQHVHLLAAAAMSLPGGQIDEKHGAELQPVAVPVQVPLIHVVDAQPIQVHYMQEAAEHVMDEDQDDDDGDPEGLDGDHPGSDPNSLTDPHRNNGNQLTLSFLGEVYVFDSVLPEKAESGLFTSTVVLYPSVIGWRIPKLDQEASSLTKRSRQGFAISVGHE